MDCRNRLYVFRVVLFLSLFPLSGSLLANVTGVVSEDQELLNGVVEKRAPQIADFSTIELRESMQESENCIRDETELSEVLNQVGSALTRMNAVKAETLLKDAFEEYPNSPALRVLQVMTLVELYQFSKAVQVMDNLIAECPKVEAFTYYRALISFKQDRLNEAEAHLRSISKNSDLHAHALLLEASILMARAKSAQALARLESAQTHASVVASDSFVTLKSMALTEQGRLKEARIVLNEYATKSKPAEKVAVTGQVTPGEPDAYVLQIYASLKEANFQNARTLAERFVAAHPKLPLASLVAFDVALQSGDVEALGASLSVLKKLAPEHPRVNFLSGFSAHAQLRHEEAIALYRLQQKEAPEHRLAYEAEIDALTDSGNYRGVLARYDEVASVLPEDYFLMVRKAKAYRELGMIKEALSWYEKAMQLAADRDLAYCAAGNTYKTDFKLDKAEMLYQQCLDRNIENTEGLSGLASVSRERGKYPEALDFAKRAIAIAPQSLLGNLEYAMANYQLGRLDAAYAACNTLRRTTFASYLHKMGVAHCFEQTGRPDKALELLQELHSQSPTPWSYERLAALLIATKNIDLAVRTYQQWVSADEANVKAHLLYGDLLYEIQKYGEAAEQFKQVVAMDPDNRGAIRALAVLAYSSGETADARGWFNKLDALGIEQDSMSAYYLAHFSAAEKQFSKALDYAEKGIAINPDGVDLLELAANIASNAGDTKKAVQYLEKLCLSGDVTLDMGRKAPLLIMLGQLYGGAGRLQDARNVFEQAVALDSSSQQAHNDLGYTDYLLGRFVEALLSYEKALALPGSMTGLIHYNRGLSLKKLARNDEAATAFEMAKRAGYGG